MDETFDWSVVVEHLRTELGALAAEADEKRLWFEVPEVEVELKVGVKKGAKGEGSVEFKVFGLGAKLGAGGE